MKSSTQTRNGKKMFHSLVSLKTHQASRLKSGIEGKVIHDDEGILYENRQAFDIIIVFKGVDQKDKHIVDCNSQTTELSKFGKFCFHTN